MTLAALSTACLAASLFGTVQAAPAPNAKLPVVAVQAVEMLPQTVSRRLAGRVTALHTVNITARVSGEIKEVAFADGALVKKGDVLYRLDDVQYQAALESAKAAVMQAQAESLYAERDYKRQQALYEQKASSRDVLDAEGAYVWVVNAPQDGAAKTQKRRVEVGRAVNGLQLITAGLQKDDVVVVEGMQKAGEGKTVKVLQAAAQSAGDTSEQPSN